MVTNQSVYDEMCEVYRKFLWGELVEVTRCKDCKHRDPEDKKCDCGHGILWQLPRDDNWFCGDGDRKEEDDERGEYDER